MTDSYEQIMQEAREAGRLYGVAAASGLFDGNTDHNTYVAVLAGIEDGDPRVMDLLPSSPLSGEWADSPTPESVLADLGVTDEDDHGVDDYLCAYEDGFYEGSQDEIVRICLLQTEEGS